MKTHRKDNPYLSTLKNIRGETQSFGQLSDATKKQILLHFAARIAHNKKLILDANEKDIRFARSSGRNDAFIDRLTLTDRMIDEIVKEVHTIAQLPDPIGKTLETYTAQNGVLLKKIAVPLGVIFIIYESRPDVTVSASALAIKSGNAVILKGGSEALQSNKMFISLLEKSLTRFAAPKELVTFIERSDRSLIQWLLRQSSYIDVVIPRGGYSLVKFVQIHARIPILSHSAGGARIYVDQSADQSTAAAICVNAKTSKPATCNSADTIIVHSKVARQFIPILVQKLKQKSVELYGDSETRTIADIPVASEKHWSTEFLSKKLSIKIVHSAKEAIRFISKYSKHHSEGIIATDKETIAHFIAQVDAASVFVNCSTRLHDGTVYGFGSEMGIATGKLHARGPVGLRELTSYKWVAFGNGQLRN